MLLAGMLEAAHTFVQKAAQLAAQEGASSPVPLPAAIYPPFQPQLDRYGYPAVPQHAHHLSLRDCMLQQAFG